MPVHDISFAEYRKLPGCNWSSISKLETHSPHQYRYVLDEKAEESKAEYFLIGRALHTAVLEPHLFDEEFFVEPVWGGGLTTDGRATFSKLSNAYKKFRAKFEGEAGDRTILTHEEFTQVTGMRDSVSRHTIAGSLLSSAVVEKSVTWVDPVSGMECKGRIDAVTATGRVVDLKTTIDIRPDEFNRSIWKYGYAGQVTFYMDGAKRAGLDVDTDTPPAIIAVQKLPPFEVAVFRMSPEAMAVGRRQYRGYLNTIRLCEELDAWPEHAPDREIEIQVPGSVLARIETAYEKEVA